MGEAIDKAWRLLKLELAPPMTQGVEEQAPMQEDIPMVDMAMGDYESPCECAERIRSEVLGLILEEMELLYPFENDAQTSEMIDDFRKLYEDWQGHSCEEILQWAEGTERFNYCNNNMSETDQMKYASEPMDLTWRLLKQGLDLAPPMTRGAGEEMMPVQDDVPMIDESMGGGHLDCDCAERVREYELNELNNEIQYAKSLIDYPEEARAKWISDTLNEIAFLENASCEDIENHYHDSYNRMCISSEYEFNEKDQMKYAGEPMDLSWRLLKEEEKDYNPYSENEEDLMSAPWDLQMAIQEQAYALAEQNTPWDKEKYPTWHDWQEAIEVEGEMNLAHMMMSPEYGYLREWYHQLGKAPDSYGWATQEDMGMKERDDYLDYHKDMGIPLPGESFAIDIPGIDEPIEIDNHPQGHKENPFKPTMYEKDGKPTWPLGVVYNEETGFTRSEPMNIAMRLLKRETHPGYPKNMTIQDLINAGFDFPFNTEKYPDEDITEEEHIAEYGEAPFNPYEPIFADEADEPLNFKLDAKDIHNYRKRMYENTLNAMNERSPDFANAQWAKWIAGDALPPAPPDSPLRMRRQVLIPSEEGDVATIDAMLDEPDYTGATMAQSFKDIPFNEETGFTRSEPMDLAMRLLKDISQGYSSVILNEPEQMLSMVDELGIRDHLPPDFTHEEGRFPHHMTLNMGHLPEGWEHGQPVDLTIDGWGIVNEPKAQAMAFRVNRESLPAPIDEDRTPHISTMVGSNGKPMHSNQIVEWNDIEPFNVKGLVSGRSGNE